MNIKASIFAVYRNISYLHFMERRYVTAPKRITKNERHVNSVKKGRELTAYGKMVKCQLVELDMTQVELAENIGTTKQYLGKIIHGERAGTMYLESIHNELANEKIETKKVNRKGTTLTPFGKMVKCRLIELNMTQTELAALIGTTKQYLGKILHGQCSGVMYLDAIYQFTSLDQDYNFYRSTNNSKCQVSKHIRKNVAIKRQNSIYGQGKHLMNRKPSCIQLRKISKCNRSRNIRKEHTYSMNRTFIKSNG